MNQSAFQPTIVSFKMSMKLMMMFLASATIVRLDRTDLNSDAFMVVNEPATAKGVQSLAQTNIPFQIEFTCAPGLSQALCAKAEQAMNSAANRIGRELHIKKTIRVQAEFKNICTNGDECNLLGQAKSAAKFPVRRRGTTVMYPQALVKQTITSEELSFNEYDIIASFNSGIDWYFRDGSGSEIGSQQYDFELVCAHELTHGLGFITGLVDLSSSVPGVSINIPALVTGLYQTYDTSNGRLIDAGFQAINLFDVFVTSTVDTLANIGRKLEKFKLEDQPISQLLSQFSVSDAFDAAKTAYNLATTGNLYFKPPNSDPILLYSPQEYSQGSTATHLDFAFAKTSDYLMVPCNGVLISSQCWSYDRIACP